jgi:nucleotide-binding universal stress UspA family protein
MKRIMVATDGSIGAERAVDEAARLAKLLGAELSIVHVEQGFLNPRGEGPPSAEGPQMDDILYAASRDILSKARAKAMSHGLSTARLHSGLGDAAGFILGVARQENPDLIVVGKRGQGRLSGLLIGSVSQKLVSLAPCKVLVVP